MCWFQGEEVSEMTWSTFCEIVYPSSSTDHNNEELKGASLVWKTIFLVLHKKLNCVHKCCSAFALDVDVSSEVQHLIYYFKIQYLYIFFVTSLFCTLSVSHNLNEQCRIFYDILKSFYTALSFVPSSPKDEISEWYDFIVPLELV